MDSVTVYSRDNCQPCRLTKDALKKAGVEFEEIKLEDLSDRELAALREDGFASAPVVVTQHLSWSGFRPDLIKELFV